MSYHRHNLCQSITSNPKTTKTMEGTSDATDNGNGKDGSKATHGANFTTTEDLMITKAYLRVSEDSICGSKQKLATFRDKVCVVYHQIKKEQELLEEKDRQRPTHLQVMTATTGKYPDRSAISIFTCYTRMISPNIIKYVSIEKANPKASGEDLNAWRKRLAENYKKKHGTTFKFFSCYEFAKQTPKFSSLFTIERTTKSVVSSSSSEAQDPGEKKRQTGSGSSNNRPMGNKRAKQLHNSELMIDNMMKKYGFDTEEKKRKQTKTLMRNKTCRIHSKVFWLSLQKEWQRGKCNVWRGKQIPMMKHTNGTSRLVSWRKL